MIMLMIILFVSLAFLLPYGVTLFRSCIPNTQFRINGRICFCDGLGRWNEASCELNRHVTCKPGQIIWEDCSQCICQENGQLMCTNTACEKESLRMNKETQLTNVWCMPFVSYYINCSLCVCPASGVMSEARCAKDASCPFTGKSNIKITVEKKFCIPKVMYLFPCFQCQCSDDGFFSPKKCVETCKKPESNESDRRCIPKTFYREDCNVCRCPENSIADETMCTKIDCNNRFKLLPLNSLRNITLRCHRHTFTHPKCYYCECNQHGNIDENACLASECMTNIKYDDEKDKCSPGELVPICTECFCLKNGLTDLKFCTKVCSHQHKLRILETIIKDSSNHHIMDKGLIKEVSDNGICEPKSIYLDENKFCLCPENGNTNFKLCTRAVNNAAGNVFSKTAYDFSFDIPCDPSTFLEFDCNTCFCLKTGKLDPKWCTYDDCVAKKIIQESQKNNVPTINPVDGACIPGSISKVGCNFCICNENGLLSDRACTKNNCVGVVQPNINDKLTCEPLAYYNVDCNICYCPNNGFKNIAKCTKNICEKNFLRSEVCVPGDLFSEECSVCVCPPNGDKEDKVCTNNTCSDADTPWRKIFKLSQSLLSSNVVDETTRSLELCFPGEEFEVGCKVCVCPDMGLRIYATCTAMLCNDDRNSEVPSDTENHNKSDTSRRKREVAPCITSKPNFKTECSPGSVYIIKCRECICPYMDNFNYFCRPLPRGRHCEESYPSINPPVQTKFFGANVTSPSHLTDRKLQPTPRNQRTYSCENPGRLMDHCFICECENNVIVVEHCFKSDASTCENRTPTFLNKNKLLLVYLLGFLIQL